MTRDRTMIRSVRPSSPPPRRIEVDNPSAARPRLPGGMDGGFSLAAVGRPVRLLERTVWPDSGFLARPLGGAAVDSRFNQRVYRAMQTCGQQDLPPPAALRIHRRRGVRSAADDLPDPFEDKPAEQAANDPGHD